MFLRAAVYLVVTGAAIAAQNLGREDEGAIRKVIAAYVDAQNKHDAAAAARLFAAASPDRESIAKSIANEPRVWTEKTPVSPNVKAIRFIHTDVALADVTLSWYTSAMGAVSSDRIFLLVKESGEWKITVYRRMCQNPLP